MNVFLSVTYSELIGEGVWHLFILISYLHMHELLTKYPREKFWTYEIPRRKKVGFAKYPREKFSDPQRYDGTRPMRPTEFSTLIKNEFKSRSSRWRCSVKKVFFKFSQNSQENAYVGVTLSFQHMRFPANFAKFLRTLF